MRVGRARTEVRMRVHTPTRIRVHTHFRFAAFKNSVMRSVSSGLKSCGSARLCVKPGHLKRKPGHPSGDSRAEAVMLQASRQSHRHIHIPKPLNPGDLGDGLRIVLGLPLCRCTCSGRYKQRHRTHTQSVERYFVKIQGFHWLGSPCPFGLHLRDAQRIQTSNAQTNSSGVLRNKYTLDNNILCVSSGLRPQEGRAHRSNISSLFVRFGATMC